jgi:CheY-like chemotaxis protein
MMLDIGLPDTDGYALARQMRAIPEVQGAVLVALTGYGQPEDQRLAMEAGFDHHLVKPADLDRVAEILAQVQQAQQAEL